MNKLFKKLRRKLIPKRIRRFLKQKVCKPLKKPFNKYVVKNVRKYANKPAKSTYKWFYRFIKVNNKSVLFIAYHGRGYLCNPKAIHQYMSQDEAYKDYEFVWVIKRGKKVKIPNAKIIYYNSPQYFYYLSRCKYWVFNCKMPNHLIKKEEQVYLQTWHGTPLKRLANDINIGKDATFYRTQVTKEQMAESYKNDSAKYDYFISPNEFSSSKFESAFQVEASKIIETGYPRNDVITNATETEIAALKRKYKIPADKKVILYAPTWRDNSFNNKGYVQELKVDFNLWHEQLGDEYVVIYKPHYLIVNKHIDKSLKNFLYSINENADINDLYVISDVLITDYSSVFFDYANLNRPVLFYMYDVEEYGSEIRGFYLDIYKDLPGDVIVEEMDLLEALKDISAYSAKTEAKLESFNERFNYLQTGDCSKRVVEMVIK